MTDFRKIDLMVLLDKLNIVYEIDHDKEIQAICPLPDHDDTEPSWYMCAREGSLYGRWHCFGCHQKGDPATLVARVKGWNRSAAMVFLQKEFGIGKGGDIYSNPMTDFSVERLTRKEEPVQDFESYFTHIQLLKGIENEFSDYLESRNVTKEEIEDFEVCFARAGYFEGRVVFPIYTEGELRTLWARDITGEAKKKIRYPKAKKTMSRALFNYDIAMAFKTVWLVEGIFDALRIRRLGHFNVVAILSSFCSDYQARLLSEFRKVTVVPDADEGGQTLLKSVVSQLKFQTSLMYVSLDEGEDPDSCPDLSQKLLKPIGVFEQSANFKLGIKYDTKRR